MSHAQKKLSFKHLLVLFSLTLLILLAFQHFTDPTPELRHSMVQAEQKATLVEEFDLDTPELEEVVIDNTMEERKGEFSTPAGPHDLSSGHITVLESVQKDYRNGEIDFPLLRRTLYVENQPPVFPQELAELDGKRVKMVGFMTPFDDLEDMKNFMVFPYVTGCFFCAPPSIEEVILVQQKTKEKTSYLPEPVVVEGTLKLWNEDRKDPVFDMFLYIIDDAEVKVYDPQSE